MLLLASFVLIMAVYVVIAVSSAAMTRPHAPNHHRTSPPRRPSQALRAHHKRDRTHARRAGMFRFGIAIRESARTRAHRFPEKQPRTVTDEGRSVRLVLLASPFAGKGGG